MVVKYFTLWRTIIILTPRLTCHRGGSILRGGDLNFITVLSLATRYEQSPSLLLTRSGAWLFFSPATGIMSIVAMVVLFWLGVCSTYSTAYHIFPVSLKMDVIQSYSSFKAQSFLHPLKVSRISRPVSLTNLDSTAAWTSVVAGRLGHEGTWCWYELWWTYMPGTIWWTCPMTENWLWIDNWKDEDIFKLSRGLNLSQETTKTLYNISHAFPSLISSIYKVPILANLFSKPLITSSESYYLKYPSSLSIYCVPLL